ncbi:MAG: sensor histidine kinase [Cellulosilyticaceae bacterium]
MITELCKRYTALTDYEISKIIDISNSLDFMAKFYECDVFIDVLSINKNQAVVVAHSKPENKSLYNNPVVGQMARRENEPGVLRTLETGLPSNDIRAITQENKFVKQRIHPILEDDKAIGVVIVEKDISNEIKSDFEINMTNNISAASSNNFMNLVNRNDFVANSLDDAILIFDTVGNLIIRNNKALNIYKDLGYIEDIQGMHYNNLTLDSTTFEQIKKHSNELGVDEDKQVKIGDYWFKLHRIVVNEAGFRVVLVIKDITDIKHKEAEIVLKSVAVREAHHRVKNNLQTVAALLRRQAKITDSTEAKICLRESIDRIMTIAETHDLLSKSCNSRINISDAISSLIRNVRESFGNSKNIQIYVTGEEFEVEGDKATALLLTINEIIQNCYDHAFAHREQGTIQILLQGDDDYKTIAVVDDGEGFIVENVQEDSLGLYIVRSYITSILKGSIDIQSNNKGTRVVLRFLNN